MLDMKFSPLSLSYFQKSLSPYPPPPLLSASLTLNPGSANIMKNSAISYKTPFNRILNFTINKVILV